MAAVEGAIASADERVQWPERVAASPDDILKAGMRSQLSVGKLCRADACTVMVHLYKWNVR